MSEKFTPTLKPGAKILGLIPQSIEEAARLADGFFKSGMCPESYIVKAQNGNTDEAGTKARLLIGILKGLEVGLPPVAALSTIYIVNNRPTIYGDGALALVLGSGLCEWTDERMEGTPKTDGWKAICTVKRVGVAEPMTREFTWSDAKGAGLAGKPGPWSKFTARQMQMRARAFALRDGFSDVLMGLGITEEQRDVEQEVSVPKLEAQQDAFTLAALGVEPQPVPIEPPQQIEAPAQSVCATCGGKGIAEFSETDQTTGEITTGFAPCPECSPVAKQPVQMDPADLFMAG